MEGSGLILERKSNLKASKLAHFQEVKEGHAFGAVASFTHTRKKNNPMNPKSNSTQPNWTNSSSDENQLADSLGYTSLLKKWLALPSWGSTL